MGITTTSSAALGHSLSSRTKCWVCNKPSAAFRVHPASGRDICIDCSMREGLDMPIEESNEPIGTIEQPKKQ